MKRLMEVQITACEPVSSEPIVRTVSVDPETASILFTLLGTLVSNIKGKIVEDAEEEIPAASVEQVAEDPRYASVEVHTLPLDAAKLEFLRVDGFWFVKTSEGVQEAIESAWRADNVPVDEPCGHIEVTVDDRMNGCCKRCGADLDFNPETRRWDIVKGGAQ